MVGVAFWENWDSKELRDLSKVTQLEGFPGPKGGGVGWGRTIGDCREGF